MSLPLTESDESRPVPFQHTSPSFCCPSSVGNHSSHCLSSDLSKHYLCWTNHCYLASDTADFELNLWAVDLRLRAKRIVVEGTAEIRKARCLHVHIMILQNLPCCPDRLMFITMFVCYHCVSPPSREWEHSVVFLSHKNWKIFHFINN